MNADFGNLVEVSKVIQEQTNGLPKSASPQAEAAYPDAHWEPPFRDLQRKAFDAGRRSRDAEVTMHEQNATYWERAASSSLVATREAIEQWSFEHRPILSMKDGSIAGCKCLDRVFYRQHEDWDSHIAETLLSGVVREVGDVKAEQREKDAVIAESHRPEVGTHINVSEYRTGKYDAATNCCRYPWG